jgi:hypothetical protein
MVCAKSREQSVLGPRTADTPIEEPGETSMPKSDINNSRMFFVCLVLTCLACAQTKPRTRDLGVPFDGVPGPLNAITDVKGVEVGHTTLISGDATSTVGVGPVRTGVTAILPRGKDSDDPVFAGWFTENGNGEMTASCG